MPSLAAGRGADAQSNEREYHELLRELMAVGCSAVKEQSFVIANNRSVNPANVKHPATVYHHRRAVRSAFAVVGVRNQLGVAKSHAGVLRLYEVHLLVSDVVFPVQAAILERKINRVLKRDERGLMNIGVSKVAGVDRRGEGLASIGRSRVVGLQAATAGVDPGDAKTALRVACNRSLGCGACPL